MKERNRTRDPGKLPGIINLSLLAENRQNLRGSYMLSQLPRFDQDMIPQPGAMVTFCLRFQQAPAGEVSVTGEIEYCCSLLCVRCTRRFEMAIRNDIRWQTVADWHSAQRLSPGVEPLPASEKGVKLVELIEDEVLLGIPDSPRHPGNCPLPGENEV